MRATLLLAALGCVPAAWCQETLAERIQHAIDEAPAARTAFWGIQVVDLESGETRYELNPDRFFVPASNTKLFTTALALARLGPTYRFTTSVRAVKAPTVDGVVDGALILAGHGDPNLSARELPYRPGPVTGDALRSIDELAAQVVERGVRRVRGGIVGDDTWYVWEPYPDGWSIDDARYEYGAPVSALTLNDNTITLRLRAGESDGDLAVVTLDPPLEFYQIDNRVRSVAGGERRVHLERDAGGRHLRLWGTLPIRNGVWEAQLAVEDPARFAAAALRQALEARGVVVEGEVAARHVFANQVADLTQAPAGDDDGDSAGFWLASRESAPLAEDLRVTDKVSQNLHAEMALRAVARARRHIGSREAGLEEMRTFLDELGVERGQYRFTDGSGLSRLNLVTPATVLTLLRFMSSSPQRDTWLGLLPIGGQDGTLDKRLAGTPAEGRVHAKTGSLSHVAALSGYAQRASGEWVAFSILVNNFNGPAAEVRGAMDRICNLIVE